MRYEVDCKPQSLSDFKQMDAAWLVTRLCVARKTADTHPRLCSPTEQKETERDRQNRKGQASFA